MQKKRADQVVNRVLSSIESDPEGAIDRTVALVQGVKKEAEAFKRAIDRDPAGSRRALAAEGVRLLAKLATK